MTSTKDIQFSLLLGGAVRHDIRNQLFFVLMMLELMKGDEEKRERIIGAVERITAQLDFWKDYQEGGDISWQSLESIYKGCTGFFKKINTDVTIEIEDFSGVGEIKIYASSLICKVFENLVDNTLRYGGEKAGSVKISHAVVGDSLYIFYKDDGNGIKDEDKKRIFDKGFGKNTGMGLYLTREILNISGIKISEEGEFGEGARFVIVVPKGSFLIQ